MVATQKDGKFSQTCTVLVKAAETSVVSMVTAGNRSSLLKILITSFSAVVIIVFYIEFDCFDAWRGKLE